MSTVPGAATIWRGNKTLNVTGHSWEPQSPAPISPRFVPPNCNAPLTFNRYALAASIARTVTLRAAPPPVLLRWAYSALAEVEWLIGGRGTTFALSPDIQSLADSERTSFAGRVGAGVTDLLMSAMGYGWRDNASSLNVPGFAYPDFIYSGGNAAGLGAVLAEAHGTFAANVTSAGVARQAQKKYWRQVKPHLASTSSHGQSIHGYSIAFGCRPGSASAYLQVAETEIPGWVGAPPSRAPQLPATARRRVHFSQTHSAHRSNFILMNASAVAEWIDWVYGIRERPEDTYPVTFLRITCDGMAFLLCIDSLCSSVRYPIDTFESFEDVLAKLRSPTRNCLFSTDGLVLSFVMEERAAKAFLNGLSEIVRRGREFTPESFDHPELQQVGFSIGTGDYAVDFPDTDQVYALYSDGLALLSGPLEVQEDPCVWIPNRGLQSG